MREMQGESYCPALRFREDHMKHRHIAKDVSQEFGAGAGEQVTVPRSIRQTYQHLRDDR